MIAFAFYGDPKSSVHQRRGYFEGIRANLGAISSFYNSSWVVRLYHDIGSDDPMMADLCSLACSTDQLDLCSVPQLPHPLLAKAVHMFPMIWRFFPTLDTQVDAFMSRDLDSIVTPREVKAVEEWVQSGKTLHTMRDHPQHNFPMLGGMWGVQMPRRSKTWRAVWKAIFGPTSLPTPSARVTEAPRVQTRLCRVGMCGEDSLEGSDSFFCTQYPGAVGFPSERPNSTANIVGGEAYREQQNIECPTQCRRKQSWRFC